MCKFSNGIAGRQSHADFFRIGGSKAAFGAVVAIIGSCAAFIVPSVAAEDATPIADLSGDWERPVPTREAIYYPLDDDGPQPVTFSAEVGEIRQGMPYIGDDTNPILLPHAAEALRAQRDMYRRGEVVWSPWAICWPAGVPLVFGMVNAVQFLQTEDQITIIYQRGQMVRRVDLNEAHPTNPALSWFGHSVGHYEGENTLVIDTIAQDTRVKLDRFGTPKSEAMRIVERYTISTDGQRLDVEFNVEDPKTFATAWSAKVGYERLPARSGDGPQEAIFAEIICPENNRDAAGGDYPIPVATTHDY